MGWYISYEIEFSSQIDWDDLSSDCLNKFNVQHLYLRDLKLPCLIVCIYSTHSIGEILDALKITFHTTMRYRKYNSDVWYLHY
jgi:hypothetical protein